MATRASADDLEEIAEGKASARDKREAGVGSAKSARRILTKRRGTGVKTTVKHLRGGKRYKP